MMPPTDKFPTDDKTRAAFCVTNRLDDAAIFRSRAAAKVIVEGTPARFLHAIRFLKRDIDRMFRVADALETGMIGINDYLEIETRTFNSSI